MELGRGREVASEYKEKQSKLMTFQEYREEQTRESYCLFSKLSFI